ncbi:MULTISPECIES: hypothetical protein, partial [unclassified Collinsella]|uniref:hypothetical protein n=1 Tax=unclassified Collinsella TaxID=2637548 RepID=UPI001F3FC8F3
AEAGHAPPLTPHLCALPCPPTFFDLFGHRCARLAAAMLNITLDKTDSAGTPVEEELILAVFNTIKYKYEQF